MTVPRLCIVCGAKQIHAKGLCGACYQAQRYHKQRDAGKLPMPTDRSDYTGEVIARNRSWLEQHRKEQLKRVRDNARRRRQAGKRNGSLR